MFYWVCLYVQAAVTLDKLAVLILKWTFGWPNHAAMRDNLIHVGSSVTFFCSFSETFPVSLLYLFHSFSDRLFYFIFEKQLPHH